jgi:hypothetical protein
MYPILKELIMAYRFNNGRGGVTCDICNILIDSDLGYEEYKECYGKTGHDGDYCWQCVNNVRKQKDLKDLKER